jgi:hypothetical protein
LAGPATLRPATSGPPIFTALEREALERALPRGPTVDELVDVIMRLRGQRPARPQTSEEWEADRSLEDLAYQEVVPPWRAFRAKMAAELAGLAKHIQDAFRALATTNKVEPVDYYWRLRGDFLASGYSDPPGVFKQIVAPEFVELLGITVQNGAHREVVKRLAAAERDMGGAVAAAVRRELEAAVAFRVTKGAETAAIIGFQPRRIANSAVLSNHALGLAIDVNAFRNPHIVNKDVRAVLKEITKGTPGAPDGFDFGKAFVDPASKGPTDEAELKFFTDTLNAARAASEAVRKWVSSAFDTRAHYLFMIKLDNEEVAQAEAALREAKNRNASAAEIQALTKRVSDARDALAIVRKQQSEDADLKRLAVLETEHRTEVQEWSIGGIVNMPLELVVALAAKGFTWGETFASSKDAMHFELPLDLLDKRTGEAKAPPPAKGTR